MPDTNIPSASARSHVVDMFRAALPTLPHAGAADSEPQADEGLAIDPELGAGIDGLLSRLYHGREEIAVVMRQPNGGRRDYQVRSLRHDYRGEEGPDRPASFVASVLRVAQFGAVTRMTVTIPPPAEDVGVPNGAAHATARAGAVMGEMAGQSRPSAWAPVRSSTTASPPDVTPAATRGCGGAHMPAPG